MKPQERLAKIQEQFHERYQQPAQAWGRAPGRVDLMGSHTDYNMGYVMTMTIDRDTWIAATPRSDRKVCVYSTNVEGGGEFSLDSIEKDPRWHWTDYIRGMAAMLQECGFLLTGFNGLIDSTVPFGSGLSSSAAIEMATAVVFQQVSHFQLDPVEMALLGQKTENRFVGVNCGILDQYSSAMGKAGCSLLLDCRSLKSQVSPIATGIRVVICDTRAKRALVGSEYDDRRAQCEQGVKILQQFDPEIQALRDVSLEQFEQHCHVLPPLVAKRCRFILQENQRVVDLAAALSTGDRAALGRLYRASFEGARDFYEICIPAMEAMMEAMLSGPGIIGARQAGAGFGGCMVALVEDGQVEAFQEQVARRYIQQTGIEPAIYPVEASAGAGPVRLASFI